MGQPQNQKRNKKYMGKNKNVNSLIQKFGDTAKVFIRRKYITIQAYLNKQEKSQMKNMTLHLMDLKKDQK